MVVRSQKAGHTNFLKIESIIFMVVFSIFRTLRLIMLQGFFIIFLLLYALLLSLLSVVEGNHFLHSYVEK